MKKAKTVEQTPVRMKKFDYLSGSGCSGFDSDMFYVHYMVYNTRNSGRVETTEIVLKGKTSEKKILFKGDCCNLLNSDAKCFSVLTPEEILFVIKEHHAKGVEDGKLALRMELKNLLHI
jgi:hypothetical protein